MITDLGDGYELDDDRDRVDLDALWDLLQREAYWGRFRTRDVVERQVERSWSVLGAYRGGVLIGFARAVGDGEALGYLADVVVEPAHRGCGIGKALARGIVESPEAAGWRWMLHTRDAHSLYWRLGFRPPDGTYLERPRRTPLGDPSESSQAVLVVATFDVPVQGVDAFRSYEAAVLPLLRDHGGRLERRMRDDTGTFEVHVLRFPSADAFAAYRSDPRRADLMPTLERSGAVVRAVEVTEIT
jgi:GNAT superfamily N-acetyltransferase